ncbi:hypothetical protein DEJ48_38940 [Streptomyces venezuelae]|uniref:Uncharacterized protein n=1 Tax=Streptomyces venezuelae TaxID=54571 RepID=A0A5P2C7C4_STRVZ|nr:hypothetical protein DEJ48_38940 [Streptomyces venezuelae]
MAVQPRADDFLSGQPDDQFHLGMRRRHHVALTAFAPLPTGAGDCRWKGGQRCWQNGELVLGYIGCHLAGQRAQAVPIDG